MQLHVAYKREKEKEGKKHRLFKCRGVLFVSLLGCPLILIQVISYVPVLYTTGFRVQAALLAGTVSLANEIRPPPIRKSPRCQAREIQRLLNPESGMRTVLELVWAKSGRMSPGSGHPQTCQQHSISIPPIPYSANRDERKKEMILRINGERAPNLGSGKMP